MANQSDFEEITSEFLKKNFIEESEEPYVKNFKQKMGRFLGQSFLENHQDISSFLLEMLKNYDYYSEKLVRKILERYYEDFVKTLPEHQTIFSSIPSEKNFSILNSSNLLVNQFLNINYLASSQSMDLNTLLLDEENKYLKRDNSKEIAEKKYNIKKLQYIDNIIFIDDFSGSGDTIKAFLKRAKDILKDKNIYIYIVHLTLQAKKNIEDAFKEFKYNNAHLHYYELSKKIFNDKRHTIKGVNRKKLIDFEKNIIGSNRPLGFSGCESLVTFYRNSPNNTLSSFWWNKSGWSPLFPRKDKNIIDFFGDQQRQRNAIEHLKEMIPDDFIKNLDLKETIYLVSVNSSDVTYEKIEIAKILGYTEVQLLELEKSLEMKGLLESNGNLSVAGLTYLKKLRLVSISLSDLTEKKMLEKSSDSVTKETVYTPRKFSSLE